MMSGFIGISMGIEKGDVDKCCGRVHHLMSRRSAGIPIRISDSVSLLRTLSVCTFIWFPQGYPQSVNSISYALQPRAPVGYDMPWCLPSEYMPFAKMYADAIKTLTFHRLASSMSILGTKRLPDSEM